MTHAYARTYLADAEDCLSCAFDYATHDCGVALDSFVSAFMRSGLARLFESGSPSVVSGMSGLDLACTALEACGLLVGEPEPTYTRGLSPEYWAGWALAQYQWDRGCRFDDIFSRVAASRIAELYDPYHEADITVFMECLDHMIVEATPRTTALALLRRRRGLTQEELARSSGVGLKSIQAYEQRTNDINKATAETVYSLSRVLGCEMCALLEFRPPLSIEYDSRLRP